MRSVTTDIDWCREHGIAVSTFYYWVKQLRKESAQIPEPAYGYSENPRPRQDVVRKRQILQLKMGWGKFIDTVGLFGAYFINI